MIRIPLRFRTEEEKNDYFFLRKQANKKNMSLNAIILNLIKNSHNDHRNSKKNTQKP